MTFKVVMLQSAQTDLKTLRHYIIKQFSAVPGKSLTST